MLITSDVLDDVLLQEKLCLICLKQKPNCCPPPSWISATVVNTQMKKMWSFLSINVFVVHCMNQLKNRDKSLT